MGELISSSALDGCEISRPSFTGWRRQTAAAYARLNRDHHLRPSVTPRAASGRSRAPGAATVDARTDKGAFAERSQTRKHPSVARTSNTTSFAHLPTAVHVCEGWVLRGPARQQARSGAFSKHIDLHMLLSAAFLYRRPLQMLPVPKLVYLWFDASPNPVAARTSWRLALADSPSWAGENTRPSHARRSVICINERTTIGRDCEIVCCTRCPAEMGKQCGTRGRPYTCGWPRWS